MKILSEAFILTVLAVGSHAAGTPTCYTDNYDDLTGGAVLPSLNRVEVYNGLNYSGFVVFQPLNLTAIDQLLGFHITGAITGPQPQSGRTVATIGELSSVTGTGQVTLKPQGYVYPAPGIAYFTLSTFYLSCIQNGGAATGLFAVGCTVTFEGMDIDDKAISAQSFEYKPNVLSPKMAKQTVAVRFQTSKLKYVKVTLEKGGLTTATTVVEIDDFKHCNYV